MNQYGQCSINNQCGCLHRSALNRSGICADLSLPCSQLVSCRTSDNFCFQPNYVCVNHPRCNMRPVCYPLSMANEKLCPGKLINKHHKTIIKLSLNGTFCRLANTL